MAVTSSHGHVMPSACVEEANRMCLSGLGRAAMRGLDLQAHATAQCLSSSGGEENKILLDGCQGRLPLNAKRRADMAGAAVLRSKEVNEKYQPPPHPNLISSKAHLGSFKEKATFSLLFSMFIKPACNFVQTGILIPAEVATALPSSNMSRLELLESQKPRVKRHSNHYRSCLCTTSRPFRAMKVRQKSLFNLCPLMGRAL